MDERNRKPNGSDLFDRVHRMVQHDRKRRWDSALQLIQGPSDGGSEPQTHQMPHGLVAERFDSLEREIVALKSDLRRVECRLRHSNGRAQFTAVLGLATVVLIVLMSGEPHGFLSRLLGN